MAWPSWYGPPVGGSCCSPSTLRSRRTCGFQDYLPEILAQDRRDFPTLAQLTAALGPTRVVDVPVPRDCTDGFLLAFWGRPEAVLDPAARAATSGFARMNDEREAAAVARLARDLASGAWDRAHGQLRTLPALDVGLRLAVTELA